MKLAMILTILLLLAAGCSKVQDSPTNTISGNQDLVLNAQDLSQLGMTGNGTNCQTEHYQTDEYSSLAQYSFCSYNISSLKSTEVVIELKKFTNLQDRNGSFLYESSHLRGYQGADQEAFQGLISENDYGDMSSFYFNKESTVYYYHLYIAKNEYLIHITSKGSKEAKEYIAEIGQKITSKF